MPGKCADSAKAPTKTDGEKKITKSVSPGSLKGEEKPALQSIQKKKNPASLCPLVAIIERYLFPFHQLLNKEGSS